MILKSVPEDFVVDEVFKREFKEEGKYFIYHLKKRDITTEGAVSEICRHFGIQRKQVGYAGLKDKVAVTSQYISIYNHKFKKDFIHDKISLDFVGKSTGPVSLGDLEGNNFKIVVRELDSDKIFLKKVPNYFDEQRFSTNNHIIGKLIIKSDFKKACELILENDYHKAKQLMQVLNENPNDYVNALKKISFKMLKLYVHAYQSYLWNELVFLYLKDNFDSKQKKVPIPGFGVVVDDEFESIYDDLLEKEDVSPRDFIIREIPDLSAEGTYRDLYIDYSDLTYSFKSEQGGKYTCTLTFYLPKGSYATMLVKNLLNGSSGI